MKPVKQAPPIVKHILNPELDTLDVTDYKGVPVNAAGQFVNLEHPFYPYFSEVWKWQRSSNPQKEEKRRSDWRIPVADGSGFLESRHDGLLWLGHASYFLRINGVTFLTDPVLGDLNFLIRRKARLPVDPARLRNIDYILVSHDHRDHCDKTSIQRLAVQNPGATYLTGLEMAPLLRKWTGSEKIISAGWYQQYPAIREGVELFYLPTRHWCRRGLRDVNIRLWGAFLFRFNGKTLYWGGDTGWWDGLDRVSALFGPPDIYLAGVGAYKPEWFMHPSHMSPADAARSAKLLDAGLFVPMHYGVFDLSDEPMGEPEQILREMQLSDPFLRQRLRFMAVGGTLEL